MSRSHADGFIDLFRDASTTELYDIETTERVPNSQRRVTIEDTKMSRSRDTINFPPVMDHVPNITMCRSIVNDSWGGSATQLVSLMEPEKEIRNSFSWETGRIFEENPWAMGGEDQRNDQEDERSVIIMDTSCLFDFLYDDHVENLPAEDHNKNLTTSKFDGGYDFLGSGSERDDEDSLPGNQEEADDDEESISSEDEKHVYETFDDVSVLTEDSSLKWEDSERQISPHNADFLAIDHGDVHVEREIESRQIFERSIHFLNALNDTVLVDFLMGICS